jgi:hypothetical protein
MDLKRLRLRNLVNKELSFYPRKSVEREVINKYDSDEENKVEYDSEIEEERKGARQNTYKENEVSKEKTLEELKSQIVNEKSETKIKHELVFEKDVYIDEEIIDHLKNSNILNILLSKFNSDEVDTERVKFYANVLQYVLKNRKELSYDEYFTGLKLIENICETQNEQIFEFLLSALDSIIEIRGLEYKTMNSLIPLLKQSTVNEKNEITYKNIINNINKAKKNFHFTKDQYKDLMTISFTLLRDKRLSNVFLQLVDILCYILRTNKDYYPKFIELLICSFKDFLDENDISNSKVYLCDKKIIKQYYIYYGIYNSYNTESISLFSLLFIRAFSYLYTDGNEETNFNNMFELFFNKLLESRSDNILLCIFCLITDLLHIKYNIEFSANVVILTNIFLCLSNLTLDENVEMNRRKLFLNCYELVIDNLLYDFRGMKKCFLCYSKDKPCGECFNCMINSKENKYIHCSNCNINTNLNFQLTNQDENVCSFCELKYLFEKYPPFCDGINYTYTPYEHKQNDKFELFFKFHDALYDNSLFFIQLNTLNYLNEINRSEIFSEELENNFLVFLGTFLSDYKIKTDQKFQTSVKELFINQKNKIMNILTEFTVSDTTINYYYFYFFYINFLFVGNIKLVENLLTENLHWNVRYKSLKILEKYLPFQDIFHHFDVDTIGSLLSDSSSNIREYSLEILLKFYKNKKIEKDQLLCILYENINESSFLIRKRIITTLADLSKSEEEHNVEHFKSVNFVFLNKIGDSSESMKIKNIIYDYYYDIFNSSRKSSLASNTINIFVKIMSDNSFNTIFCEQLLMVLFINIV